MFDTDNFAVTTVTEEMDTKFPVIPEKEYAGSITKIATRSGVSEKGNEWAILDVTWEVNDAEASEVTGMDSPTVRQSVFLDITDSGGLSLGKGKNINLGRLREAVQQNGPGGWSPAQLVGASAMIRVVHRIYDGNTFADVKGVAKAA